jgi:hypothetical protein
MLFRFRDFAVAQPVIYSLGCNSKNLGNFVGQHISLLRGNHAEILFRVALRVKKKLGKPYKPYKLPSCYGRGREKAITTPY